MTELATVETPIRTTIDSPLIDRLLSEASAFSERPAEDRSFVDRRSPVESYRGVERRQFRATPETSRPEAAELQLAVDAYKLDHRRRFITYDELLSVVESLGYHR